MFKIIPFFKKFALATLVLAIGLVTLPPAGCLQQPVPKTKLLFIQPACRQNRLGTSLGSSAKSVTSGRVTSLPKPTRSSPKPKL